MTAPISGERQRVGVEVEFIGSYETVTRKLNELGLTNETNIRGSHYGHSEQHWIVKPDGSVYDRNAGYGRTGAEMVSPPLDFYNESERAQITSAVDVLLATGCYPNDTTGVHVHVDASDLTPKQILAVVKSFYKYEDIIYRIASSGHARMRDGATGFAPKLRPEKMQRLLGCTTLRQLQEAWTGSSNPSEWNNHSSSARYCGINLMSYFYRGTIEFRIFNGSVNSERIQAYVAMCVALVEDARKGKSRSVNKRFALGGMADGSTNEHNAFHRFQQVLRYEAGMSLTDMKRLTKVWKDSRPQAVDAA